MKGKILGVQSATTHANYAQKAYEGVAEVKYYNTQDEVNADLVAGRIDAMLADQIAMDAFLKSDQGKDMEMKGSPPADPVFGEGVGVGVRKGETESWKKISRHQGLLTAANTTLARKILISTSGKGVTEISHVRCPSEFARGGPRRTQRVFGDIEDDLEAAPPRARNHQEEGIEAQAVARVTLPCRPLACLLTDGAERFTRGDDTREIAVAAYLVGTCSGS